jgi:hypothetical protein
MEALTSSRPRRVQRILEQYVGCGKIVHDLEVPRIAPELLEPAATMALFSCSLDMMRKGDALRQVYASGGEMGGVLRRRTWSKEKLATASAVDVTALICPGSGR